MTTRRARRAPMTTRLPTSTDQRQHRHQELHSCRVCGGSGYRSLAWYSQTSSTTTEAVSAYSHYYVTCRACAGAGVIYG